MGLVPALLDLVAGTIIVADDLDANFAAIRDVVNTYGVLTDVARTMTVPVVSTSAGPHALGTTPNADYQVNIGGAFTGVTNAFALRVVCSLSASSINSAQYGLVVSASFGKAASGTHSLFAVARFATTGLGGGAAAVTEAATIYVDGAPTGAAANYAIHVVGGAVLFGGTLAVTGAVTGGTYNGQTISAAAAFTGSVTVATTLGVTGVTTLTGDVVAPAIRRGTADGADSDLLVLSGGGGTTPQRGAAIVLFGNENASPGDLRLIGGDAAGKIEIYTGATALRGSVTAAGVFDWLGNVKVGGNVGFYGTAPVAKPTGVAVTAAGIHAALVTLGLIAA